MMGYTEERKTGTLDVGDYMTISGEYQRRTLWQWVTGKARRMKRFYVEDVYIHTLEEIEG